MSNILKPNCASRRWRATRRKRPEVHPFAIPRPAVALPRGGKPKRPPAWKPAKLDVTAFQKQAHERNAVTAHEFHASRSVRGTFGRSPANRNPHTVEQRKALARLAAWGIQ